MDNQKVPTPHPDSLDIYPGYLIRRMNQVSTAHFTRIVSAGGFDLTPVQFAALRTIEDRPGLDQVTLATRIAYDRVTIGGVVDRLVKKGLVTRRQSKQDRRSRELFLTEAGRDTLKAVLPFVVEVQGAIMERLTAEEERLFTDLLKKAIGG
jgi:DNA-binding MarR family transcriptional regulator